MPPTTELPPLPAAPVGENLLASRDTFAGPLCSAWKDARADLLAEQNAQGYWVGELASSPLSTATAISALLIAEQHSNDLNEPDDAATLESTELWNAAYQTDLSELILQSVRWLAEQQNADGGWGDTDRSKSNLATTLLVLSAFRMTGVPAKYPKLEPRAEQYIRAQGGPAGLKKRYGGDKTFAAPILANCALAGVVPWKQVPTLPFELAALPRTWFRKLGLPVVSYALPALVSIGLAKHHHQPSYNPLTRQLRRIATDRCLRLVTEMQPDSGGFLEATPLTSFVVMGLASTGRADHQVVRRGVEFLLASVRPDGSWPIDTNLATWNTTLAINALRKGAQRAVGSGQCPQPHDEKATADCRLPTADSPLDWLLACQHQQRHPFTDADPGGWGWTNLSGGVPDADDTAGALLALRGYWREVGDAQRARIAHSVRSGIHWLIELQNRDGGWPTFCRGWGKLPFDRSATDLTAHVLRALHAWQITPGWQSDRREAGQQTASLLGRMTQAMTAGRQYLARQQQADGSWIPLWFGNEHRDGDENPVFGTARVLLALAEIGDRDSPLASRGLQWLIGQQHADGAWGGPAERSWGPAQDKAASCDGQLTASVEETAVAVESLLPWRDSNAAAARAVEKGLGWLIEAVNRGQLAEPAPIGLYFAKLWYYERLYPKSFAVSALGAAIEQQNSEQNDCIPQHAALE